ncbi:MAG: class IV adenylate cyclase [Acidobacteriaceae bacterium]|nr:class IV adenylate cyclase [Acidobacteriaceae bacterium]MBV9498433.1 class IV adenylate cyclase [Acidobacteriaceae bacterium]
MIPTGLETEVKIRIADPAQILPKLPSAGFEPSSPRQFESNTLYDTPSHALRESGVLLRLRQFGSTAVITWKGQGEPGPYKSRPELETSIGSIEVMEKILNRLGYEAIFRYEKFRSEFRERQQEGPSGGVLTIDETPIGNFLELEGQGDWIDRNAAQLGFSAQDYILQSYGLLYLEDCGRRGVQPTHMTFAS